MQIEENINQAVEQFSAKNSDKPKFLYLGKNKWDELCLVVDQKANIDFKTIQHPEYKGLRVLVVSTDNHLNVNS